MTMELRDEVEREAASVQAAVPQLTDEGVADALTSAADIVETSLDGIAAANAADLDAAENLDEGTRDRLRLDPPRIAELAQQLRELAALPPLERLEDEWTLENGL
jgi:glutamate-5-semialdehyde dehydrogenase